MAVAGEPVPELLMDTRAHDRRGFFRDAFGRLLHEVGVLELDPERCITFQGVSCGVCARACPVGEKALALDSGGRPVIRPEGCVGCGVCVTACVTSPSSLRLSLASAV